MGASGGTGSLDRPFGTIQEAMAGAATGTIIAIGKGMHQAGFLVSSGLTFWGACAEQTVLTATDDGTGNAVLEIRAGNVAVKNLTIGASGRPGVMARVPSASVELDGVIIDRVATTNVAALGGGRISGRDVVLRDPQNTRGTTRAVIADGGHVDLERAIVEGAHEVGILVSGVSASLRLADALVRRTRGLDGALGRGIQVQMGSEAEISRTVIEENLDIGVMVDGSSSAQFEDVVVRGTGSRTVDGTAGRGIQVQGSTATLSRVRLEANHDVGLFAGEEAGTEVFASDTLIRGTLPAEASREGGRGISLQHFGTMTLDRVVLTGNHEVALFGYGAGVTLTAHDLTVTDTASQASDDRLGRGGNFEGGVAVELTRARFANNHEGGIVVGQPGTTLVATDLAVVDTKSRPSDGTLGEGLTVQWGANATVTSARFERNAEGGVFVGGDGATLIMTDVAIIDTLQAACAASTCAADPFGIALGAYAGGRTTLMDFTIDGAALCGVQLTDGSELDLMNGLVAGATVGVCLQAEGYDIARLQTSVVYERNDLNLDATTLPVPTLPTSVLGGP